MNQYVAINFPNQPRFDYFRVQNFHTSTDVVALVNDIVNQYNGQIHRNLDDIYFDLTAHLEEVYHTPNQIDIDQAITIYI